MTDRYLLLCAGNANRWGGRHGDAPKQLVEVRGEPILHRTVRLITEHHPDADIKIVVRDSRDDTWKIPGSSRTAAKLDPSRHQADKILSAQHQWSRSGRTVLLYGDVYFTDAAINTIAINSDPWAAFARFGRSHLTGKDHRELFGFAFDPDEHERITAAALRCVELHRAGAMGGWSGGWQIYAAAAGADDAGVAGRFVDRGNVVEIDDWTDDFDFARDWHQWCYRWAKATNARRAVGHPDLSPMGDT